MLQWVWLMLQWVWSCCGGCNFFVCFLRPTAENRPPVRPAVPAAPPPMRSRPPPSIAPPPLPRFLPPPSTAPPPLPSATPPPKVTLVKKTSVSVTPGWQREKPVPRGKVMGMCWCNYTVTMVTQKATPWLAPVGICLVSSFTFLNVMMVVASSGWRDVWCAPFSP